MNIYFLLSTPLAEAHRLPVPPCRGDIVCYIRSGQDPIGKAAANLRHGGVTVAFADEIIDWKTSADVDVVGARFLKEWFVDGNTDFSDLGDLSLGTSYSMEFARQINPRLLIRIGEILRRLIEEHPQADTVYSDAEDGRGIFEVEPHFHPLARVVTHVTGHMGLRAKLIKPVNALPAAFKRPPMSRLLAGLRIFIGGYRPAWRQARRAFEQNKRRTPKKPILYMFVGRAQHLIAEKIAKQGSFHVVCDQLGIPGTDAVRAMHLFAMPRLRDIRVVRKLLRELERRAETKSCDTDYVFGGIDYGCILYRAIVETLKSQVWTFLIIIAQTRKLQKVTELSALFVNGAGCEAMGNLISFNRNSGLPIYLMPHGMDLQKFSYFMPAVDNTHVTYLAYGKDHSDYFRAYLEDNEETRQILVGNPLTALMNDTRRRRAANHGKRLLLLSFGHLEFWNSARVYTVDQYYIEIFDILRRLLEHEWTVSIRPHPSHSHELEVRLAKAFGLDRSIRWDETPTFEESLCDHDVVVCNASTTFYQSLYAGWPTIFYEPDYRNVGSIEGIESDPMFTGLLTAKDLERPVTNNPATLRQMILDSLDPDSMISTFPKRFAGELAPRFIGPDPENSDVLAAEFLERDILDDAGKKTNPAQRRSA